VLPASRKQLNLCNPEKDRKNTNLKSKYRKMPGEIQKSRKISEKAKKLEEIEKD
jgi:hypothetical protein